MSMTPSRPSDSRSRRSAFRMVTWAVTVSAPRLFGHGHERLASLFARSHFLRKRDSTSLDPLSGLRAQHESEAVAGDHGRFFGVDLREMSRDLAKCVSVIAIHVLDDAGR